MKRRYQSDDSNNSGSGNSESNKLKKQFKELGFKDISLNELKRISDQFNLSKVGTKQDIWDRINYYFNIQNQIENEIKVKENLNTFKDYPIQLAIKNIEKYELSFWSIFRNKILFQKIFSNFVFSISYSYDQLVDIKHIFKFYTNGVEIIRDKVKTGSYLTFYLKDQSGLELIYNNILQDNQENTLFYNLLFSNYPKYMVETERLLIKIIQSSNIVAFKVFIENFNISLKLIKSIISREGYLFNDKIQSYEMYNYLKTNKYLPDKIKVINSSKSFINVFHDSFKVKDLIQVCQIQVDLFKDKRILKEFNQIGISTTFSSNHLDLTIKQLILELISNNNNGSNSNNSNNIIDSIKKYIKIFYSIIKVEKPLQYKILFMKFNKLFSILNVYQNNIKSNSTVVNKLIKEKDEENSSELEQDDEENKESFDDEEKDDEQEDENDEDEDEENEDEDEDEGEDEGDEEEESDYDDHFISEKEICNGDEEINYDLAILDYYKDLYEIVFLNKFNEFATTIIKRISSFNEYGKFDALEYLFKSNNYKDIILALYKASPSYIDQFKVFILKSIESTQVLDFLYSEYQLREIFFENENSYWEFIKSITVLEHYEKLMNSLSRKFKVQDSEYSKNQFLKKNIQKNLKGSLALEIIDRAFENSIYKITDTFKVENFGKTMVQYILQNRQDPIISVFKHASAINLHLIFKYGIFRDLKPNKIFNFIFNNCTNYDSLAGDEKDDYYNEDDTYNPDDEYFKIIVNCSSKSQENKEIIFKLFRHELSKYIAYDSTHYDDMFTKNIEVISSDDIKYFPRLLYQVYYKHYKNTIFCRDFLKLPLIFSHLPFFKFLISNYQESIKISLTGKANKQLIDIAIKEYQIEILELFFMYLSKKQIETLKSNNTLFFNNYFKNK